MTANALKFLEKKNGPTTIGMLIRAYRTRNNLTQEEIAKKLDVNKSYVSDVENDRKSLSMSQVIEFADSLKDSVKLYLKVWVEQSLREENIALNVEFRPIKESNLGPRLQSHNVGSHRVHKSATKKIAAKRAVSTRKKAYKKISA